MSGVDTIATRDLAEDTSVCLDTCLPYLLRVSRGSKFRYSTNFVGRYRDSDKCHFGAHILRTTCVCRSIHDYMRRYGHFRLSLLRADRTQ